MRDLGSLAFHIDNIMKNKTKYACVVVVVFAMQLVIID